MVIEFAESCRFNSEFFCVGFYDGEGGLCAFFHHIADLSCEEEITFSGHRGGFDKEKFAAYRGVGETCGDAWSACSQGQLGFELQWAEDFREVFFADGRS